jgi:uncharacterized protein YciI
MNHYLLFYEKALDHATRSVPLQEAHRDYILGKIAEGSPLLAGGNLVDEVGTTAVLLFEAEAPAVVEEFAQGDPYVSGGVVEIWRVVEWQTVVGKLAAHPL